MRIVPVALVLAGLAWPACAQSPQCGPADVLEHDLAENHGEVPAHVGMVDGQTLLAIYATPDGSTWTAVLLKADGSACIMGAGQGWNNIPQAPTGQEVGEAS